MVNIRYSQAMEEMKRRRGVGAGGRGHENRLPENCKRQRKKGTNGVENL